jgi:hypothetical protein
VDAQASPLSAIDALKARFEAPIEAATESHTAVEMPTAVETHIATGLAVKLPEGEQVEDEQVVALLTAMLDRLGAAHHRPFSRA